jgi:hypothetical protein
MNRIYNVADGTAGYVFRSDDMYIGTIRFFRSDRSMRARVEELSQGKGIAPLTGFA